MDDSGNGGGHPYEILQGSAESLPWKTGQFTACASANMFFFVKHPNEALSEIFRVLAPGGRFSMVTAGKSLLTRISMGWLYGLNIYPDTVVRHDETGRL